MEAQLLAHGQEITKDFTTHSQTNDTEDKTKASSRTKSFPKAAGTTFTQK